MTLRTKDSDFREELKVFSERLFSQMQAPTAPYRLTPDAPIFNLIHPALLKTAIMFELGLEITQPKSVVQGWSIRCYENEREAVIQHPGIKALKGFPWTIHQHVINQSVDILIDFESLGWAFLTRQASETHTPPRSLHDYQMPLWLNYALSPELWGPAGKWTRFHNRLLTLFEKCGLLVASDYPGFYRLSSKAQKMESYGFFGLKTDDGYSLTLPWDFPLSALNELENVMLREFSCSS